jgi:MFS transporter, UMF1 family
MSTSESNKKETATRRNRWAWYLYDFGNSAYAAVVLLAVYSAYFKGQVVGGAEGSRLWGRSVGIAMLVVAVISPILGTIADFSGAKKRFLFVFTVLACLATGTLFFVQEGDIFIGMLFFILAEIGYRGAQVFYNALLPDIAGPDEIGRVSGTGWALGSAGGVLCLLLILPLIMIFEGVLMVRIAFLITAGYFACATMPLFFLLEERSEPRALPPGENYLTIGFQRLLSTIGTAHNFRESVKFVIAFLVYNNGVIMALNFASIIGAVLFGMDQQALILFVILVQVTNVIGAYIFGLLADRFGSKQALTLSIMSMVVAIIMMFFAQTEGFFFFIGAVAGFAMAGMQSVSRTMVGMLSPDGQSAEFYGFFSVAERMSSFIGPAVYGWVAAEIALMYEAQGMTAIVAEQFGQRAAILTIGLFLVVGLGLLLAVNEEAARSAREVPAEGELLQAG